MSYLLDIQRKENILIDVLESNQSLERIVSKFQEEERVSPSACSLQSPVSPVDASCSHGLILGSQHPTLQPMGTQKA